MKAEYVVIPALVICGLVLSMVIGAFGGTLPFRMKCANYAEIYQYEDWRLIGGTCHYKKGGVWKNQFEWERAPK